MRKKLVTFRLVEHELGRVELSGKSLSWSPSRSKRGADELEEAEYKFLREMAIAGS
jgi:hypothetical protein